MVLKWLKLRAIFISLFLIIILGGECVGFYILNTDDAKETIDNQIIANNSNALDETKKIQVSIKGAVENPGVYEMDKDMVINDLIVKAIVKDDAYLDNINLSHKLNEQMTIYVFTKKEYQSFKDDQTADCYIKDFAMDKCLNNGYSIIITDKSKALDTLENSLININTASIDILITLPGIGEAKAKAIINYRNDNGNFKNIEDLKKVKGIGEAIFEQIKKRIVV